MWARLLSRPSGSRGPPRDLAGTRWSSQRTLHMPDAAMDKEIELKLQVAPENISVLRNHPHFANTFHDSTQQTLNSIYFDSPDQFLREHGLTLRVRQIGSKHVQTIKSVNRGSDWLERRSEEHTSELQSLRHLVCRLLLEKKKTQK